MFGINLRCREGLDMAHLAFAVVLTIVLILGIVYQQVWWWRKRAANHEMRAQAEKDFIARAAAQLDERERRYGVSGHVRAPTAEEIAEAKRKYGVSGRTRVRVVSAEEIAEARKNPGWDD
jgi:Flp pilus assembly protein TadB